MHHLQSHTVDSNVVSIFIWLHPTS